MYNFNFSEQKQQTPKKIDNNYNYSGNMLFKNNKMASPSMLDSAANLLSELKNALKTTSEQTQVTSCSECNKIQQSINNKIVSMREFITTLTFKISKPNTHNPVQACSFCNILNDVYNRLDTFHTDLTNGYQVIDAPNTTNLKTCIIDKLVKSSSHHTHMEGLQLKIIELNEIIKNKDDEITALQKDVGDFAQMETLTELVKNNETQKTIQANYIADLEMRVTSLLTTIDVLDESKDTVTNLQRIIWDKDAEINEYVNTIQSLNNKIVEVENFHIEREVKYTTKVNQIFTLINDDDETSKVFTVVDQNSQYFNAVVESKQYPIIFKNPNAPFESVVWHVVLNKIDTTYCFSFNGQEWRYESIPSGEIMSLRKENNTLWNNVNGLTTTQKELVEAHTHELASVRDSYEIQLTDLQDANDYYLSEIGHLESEANSNAIYVSKLKAEIKDLQLKYEYTLAENVKLTEENINNENSIVQLEDQLEVSDAFNTKIVDLERKLKYSYDDNEELQAEVETANNRINRMEKLIAENDANLNIINNLKAELNNVNKSLELAIQNSERVAKFRNTETIEYKKDIANMNKNIHNLYDQMEASDKKTDELINFLNKEVNVKIEELEQLKNEGKIYDEKYGELVNERNRDKVTKKEMQMMINNLKAEVEQLKAENKHVIEQVIDPEEWQDISNELEKQ